MSKPKLTFQIILGVLFIAFIAGSSCGNKGDEKKDAVTTDTTTKMEPMKKDTANKMDTAGTRPVKEGN